jgi:glycosyltransferase involved in cell wall biosynthesis
MRIKVLQIATTYQSLVSILDAKLRLLSEDPDIELCVASSFEDPEETRSPPGNFYPVHIARTIRFFEDVVSVVRLYRYIRKQKFDIIHTHTAKAGMVGALAGWLAGVPVVHTYHGLPFYNGQGRLEHAFFKCGEIALARLRKVLFSQNKLNYDQIKKIRLINRPVISEGNGILNDAIEYSAKMYREKVQGLFDRNIPHLLCISRLEPVKALEKVIDTVRYLYNNNMPVECIIAGKGYLKKALEERIRKYNLEKSITIMYTPFIHSLIAKADVMVLTSKKEGVPRGLLEAMALRKPVVATDVQGTSELVVNGVTGILVPFDDQEALNKAVVELVKNKPLQARLGEAGRARVLAGFSGEEETVRLWVQTYEKILLETKRPAEKSAGDAGEKRVLFVATVGYTIEAFLLPYIDVFARKGFEVVAFANWHFHWNKLPPNVAKEHCPFSRNALSFLNLVAFFRIIFFLRKNRFSIIYTHTPVASVLVRLGRMIARNRASVIYEIHGLHIHEKGGLVSNAVFKWIESSLAAFTDKIITINQDDFIFARKHFAGAAIYYSPGIGVDLLYYKPDETGRLSARQMHHIEPGETVLVTIADYIRRKRLDLLVESAEILVGQGYSFKWFMVGDGLLKEQIATMTRDHGLQNTIIHTGLQNDVRPYLAASDIFVLLSMQEGLPRSLLEAGAMGLPAVVTDIRGSRDLVENEVNSFLVPVADAAAASRRIKTLLDDPQLRRDFGERLRKTVSEKFSLEKTLAIHEKIFFDE